MSSVQPKADRLLALELRETRSRAFCEISSVKCEKQMEFFFSISWMKEFDEYVCVCKKYFPDD